MPSSSPWLALYCCTKEGGRGMSGEFYSDLASASHLQQQLWRWAGDHNPAFPIIAACPVLCSIWLHFHKSVEAQSPSAALSSPEPLRMEKGFAADNIQVMALCPKQAATWELMAYLQVRVPCNTQTWGPLNIFHSSFIHSGLFLFI